MLTQLRIRNFKAWQDTGNIRLAPLTVFFGTNSSGKTSLLQFLLMLQQTVQSPDRRRALNFGDARSLVDLGVWPEMVFRRESNRTLSFRLQWQALSSQLYSHSPEDEDHEEEDLEAEQEQPLAFEAEVGPLREEQAPFGLKSFGYFLRPHSQSEFAVGAEHVGGGEYRLWEGKSSRQEESSSITLSATPVNFHGFPAERLGRLLFERVLGGFERIEELQSLQFTIEEELDSLRYLGPIRMEPHRLYTWAGDLPEDVGSGGENTVEALLASRDRHFKPDRNQAEVSLEAQVARWLQHLGILESFQLKPIAPHRKEYEVFVRAAGMKDEVNLTDVGFGVSQVLPVLVQLLYVERRSTLIFEQPELHLHPRAQSSLADVFIDALQMQEEGKDRHIQLLVESHSEHFLRRLQRRVAENKLRPDQVALYFCKPGVEGSTIEELKLDEYGNISNWPENFFGDEIGDLAAMTEAAMNRQMALEGE
jgi:predicted ATPase